MGNKWFRTYFKSASAGVDEIFPALLQQGFFLEPLTKIFTASLVFGYIPKEWQNVKILFILKTGRDELYELAKSYRPISLASFFLKTMERLVDHFISLMQRQFN
jgi:hypothetical protein